MSWACVVLPVDWSPVVDSKGYCGTVYKADKDLHICFGLMEQVTIWFVFSAHNVITAGRCTREWRTVKNIIFY